MLSVLIPTYNYNIYPLAKELWEQCIKEGISFEILAQDDCSNSDLNLENQKINQLSFSNFKISEKNLGRGKNINQLAEKAKYEYLLIMEADSFPAHNNYIKNIISSIKSFPEVVFGGALYPEKPTDNNKILRWKYGNSREIKSLEYRLKNQYDFTFSWNLIIRKSIFEKIKFVAEIQVYGYDDLLFRKKLKEQKINILHINNPLIHINEEDSNTFLKKCQKAALDAKKMLELKIIEAKDIRLTKVYSLLKKIKLDKVYSFLFQVVKPIFEYNLLSKNPSLFILDLYRLGFICNT